MEHSKPSHGHIWRKKKGRRERKEKESMSGKMRDKKKRKNDKDDIRSLDGLKTERQFMQKLEESC